MRQLIERGNMTGSKPKDQPSDEERRRFLKTSMILAAIFALSGIVATVRSLFQPAPTTTGAAAGTLTSFSRLRIANIRDLKVNETINFNYPLNNEPNILVKLGQKADGGVGPDGDVVAFSQICQHLGCIYGYVAPGGSPSCNPSYKASRPVGYCCCHGSIFDLLQSAKVIGGPSPRSQPQVILEFDRSSGDVYAIGMKPPTIFGHNTGSDDVSNDLQGGTPVS